MAQLALPILGEEALGPHTSWLRSALRQLADAGLTSSPPFAYDPSLRAVFEPSYFQNSAAPSVPLALLIVNDRNLWRPFERARAMLPQLHPLDTYVEQRVRAAFALAAQAGLEADFYWGWKVNYPKPGGGETAVPLQRIAAAIGFAALGPAHLSVHPEVGPWFALRALVLLPISASGWPRPTPRHAPCSECALRGCVPALEAALNQAPTEPEPWQAWLGVRDACPVARDARYGEAQIRYHYSAAFRSAGKP